MLDNLSDQSRVWIYASDRFFSDEEAREIENSLGDFTSNWAAHGKELFAESMLDRQDKFIVFFVDEEKVGITGCSIDSQVANSLSRKIFGYGNPAGINNSSNREMANFAAHFGDYIYAVAPEDGIYRYDPSDGSVTQVHAYISPQTNTSSVSLGLYPVTKNGETVLLNAYLDTSNQIRLVFIDKDEVVTNVVGGAAGTMANNELANAAAKINNRIYVAYSPTINVSSAIGIINPEAETFTVSTYGSTTPVGSAGGSISFVPLSGLVLGSRTTVAGDAERTLFQLNGLTAISKGTFGSTGATTNQNGASQIFVHDEILYSIGTRFTFSSPDFFQLARVWLDESANVISWDDVTITVLGFNTTNAAQQDRFVVFKDIESDTGQERTILAMAFNAGAGPGGSSWDLYQFNGGDVAATYLGSVGDGYTWAPVRDHTGGGQYTWSASGELNWTLVNAEVSGSNIIIDQWIYGVPGTGGTISMDLRFSRLPDSPLTQANLISTDSGTLNGNIVEGIVPEGSGSTIRTVWAAALDGVAAGDCPVVAGRLFKV